MLRIQATIGLTTYYFASEALDYANRYWEPRISNAFQISREFNSADKTGNKIRSVDISLDNRDGFFNSIYTTSGLVNGKFVLYFNEGDNVVKTFTGRVNKINSFGDDISLTLREVGYEYLTRKFPDAQIAYDYYSASGINDSWNAIPIHLGTVNRYPCPWVNLFESHFIIGSGPIHAVKKIYFDKTVVYDSSTGQNGYKPTPESPEIKFRVFKGARAGYTDIVEGVTSSYPGFAYIQLYKIVDAVEQPADPVNPDGEAVQIYVDIEGLQNEAGNAAERNPAQILYQFFTKPYTAEEGYGLAVDSDDLDFASAITECAIQGFKIDGSVDNTTDFGEWVDEILRCCRGQLYENNGKISVRIDAAAASPTIHFDETGELGYNCIVDTWNEPERDAQTNRVKLSYSWNFENNNFNKKPSYNQESPIGDTHLQNQTHATRIQKWNTETLEYKLIKDDTTAHKLAQYYLNNIVKQLITTSLTTEVDIPNTVDAGTVVKVTSPKFGWNEKLFRITSISRSEENTEIQLKEYDASIFTFIDPGTVAESTGNKYSVYNIPAKPEMVSLARISELQADGSTQTRIDVTFVKPTENAALIALYYKPAADPESSFKILDTTSDATKLSTIWKGIESGSYNFRLAAISPLGIYSDIGIVSGDKHYKGQPGAEVAVVMQGDTIAPGTPSVTNPTPTIGGAVFNIEIAGGVPSDFSHFEIYRTVGTGAESIIDNNHTTLLFSDNERLSGYEQRKYAVVAIDKSGNRSIKSTLSAGITPLKVEDEDISNNPIIGKCFKTNTTVGVGNPGVVFDCTGIVGYNATTKSFCLDATNGNVSISGTITALAGNIGGFTIDPVEGLYAGSGNTRVQMKAGTGIWLGATAQNDALFSVTQAGAVKAVSGIIGGWSLATGCLYATNAKMYSGAANTARMEFGAGACSAGINSANAGSDISFWAGSTFANRASAPFRVTAAGALASTSGVIGGFTIDGTEGLYAGATTTRVQMKAGAGFWAGATAIGDAPFSVTQAGVIKATSGTIGGWTLASTYISGSKTTLGCYSGYGPNLAFSPTSGCTYLTFGKSPFNGAWQTNSYGIVLRINSANLFQVHALPDGSSLCAQIAGWNFNASQLYSTGCGLILCNTGAIQTGSFVTGNAGWKIDYLGNAEFNNICARGAIRTAVFIKDEISVIGGRTLIRPADIWDDSISLTATTSNYWLKSTDDFAVGDIVRIKDGLNDYWGRVTGKAITGGKPYISTLYQSGTCNWSPSKGQAVVNYGSCVGCGGILLDGQCPYIDLYTHAGSPWSALCSRVRIGNLKNWSANFACDTYGIAMGSALGQYMTYDSESGVLDIAGNINVKSTLPLSMPGGAVLDISAKGSTTATIALTGGVKDVSGNGNNGTAVGGVTIVDSEIGKAFQINGSKYISMPGTGLTGTDRTFSIWFKKTVNEVRYVQIFAQNSVQNSGSSLGLVGLWTDSLGRLVLYDGNGTTFSSVAANLIPNHNEWYHIVGTIEAGVGLKVYVNGNLIASKMGAVVAPLTDQRSVYISGYSTPSFDVAHPKVFNRALTPEEIKTLYLVGNQQESGTITADRVQTGSIQSINWGTSAGSLFNLNNGTFAMGGSSAPKLCWNGTTLSVTGNITLAAGSSGYSTLTDKPTSLSGINSTEGTKLSGIAAGATVGATWGTNLNNIPATLGTPSGTGLFLSSTNLGYYKSGTWLTYMDNTGKFYLGGTSGKLQWNGTTLKIEGNITITGGSGIANFTDAGALATVNNLDGVTDGTTYKKTTLNEKTGAGRAYSGLDSSNRLITAVIPGTAVTPSTAGLFIGSTNMGYHNGTVWKTYMDNCGNFYLGGSAAGCGLAWNAATNCLTVCGCITSCAGTIGGWTLANTTMSATTSVGNIYLYTHIPSMFTYACGGSGSYAIHGKMYWNGAYQNSFGFNVTNGASGTAAAAMGYANIGTVTLPSTTVVACGCPFFYVGDGSTSYAEYYNGVFTVKGTVCASLGNIGGFTIGTNILCSVPAAGCSVGMSSCSTSGAVAFWAGCSTIDCAPFRVTNLGAFYASKGKIGLFNIDATGLLCAVVCTYNNVGICLKETKFNFETKMFPGSTLHCNTGMCANYSISSMLIVNCSDLYRCDAQITPIGMCFSYKNLAGTVYYCNVLSYSPVHGGVGSADAALNINMIGGTACYAFCTNGRIQVQGTTYPSDRNLKYAFEDYNMLEKLRRTPIQRWKFKSDPNHWHVGFMAQDFFREFNFGYECTVVPNLDGLALRGVQELDEIVQSFKTKAESRLDSLEKKNAALVKRLQKLECEMAAIREMIN